MPGCEWVEHQGTRILVVRYGGCLSDQAMLDVLAEQVRIVRAQPERVRVVHDYTGAHLNQGFLDASTKLSKERREISIEKAAMVGLTGFQKAIVTSYRVTTGDTNSRAFGTLAEALDWVAAP